MSPSALSRPLAVGDIVDQKLRIVRVLGEGGMGIVYVAHHIHMDRQVAVKVLRPEMRANVEVVARFAREARLASKIVDEHIARVLDVGEVSSGAPYIMMELLEGEDLASLLKRRGPLPLSTAVSLLLEACEGLATAHARGVIHRDLKPSNLFQARTASGGSIIKILDFGISKYVALDAATSDITRSEAVLGSPSYMSPEQVRAPQSVDARTDVWALGVILHRLLTNDYPFPGTSVGDTLARVLSDEPIPVRAKAPSVPHPVQAMISKCLEKSRERRYPSVHAFARDLAPYAATEARADDTIVDSSPPAMPPRLTPLRSEATPSEAPPDARDAGPTSWQRWPWLAVAGVAALAVVSALAVVIAIGKGRFSAGTARGVSSQRMSATAERPVGSADEIGNPTDTTTLAMPPNSAATTLSSTATEGTGSGTPSPRGGSAPRSGTRHRPASAPTNPLAMPLK